MATYRPPPLGANEPPPEQTPLIRASRQRSRLLTLLVSVAALASFGGVVYWAHQQDVQSGGEGIVPLIRADKSPTKVRPDVPGGMEVPNQDKTVYDRLAPGSAPPPPERLLPPPPEPQIPPASVPPGLDHAGIASQLGAPPGSPPAATPAAPAAGGSGASVQPPAAAAAPATPPAKPDGAETVAAPSQDPAAAQGAAPPPAPAAPPPQAGPSIASLIDSISAYRIQLASVRSEEQARATWARLQKGNGDVLGSLSLRALRVDLGGDKGIYYRVQAGPLDEGGAQSACNQLRKRSIDCIVVKP